MNADMHLRAMIEQVHRYNWRLRFSALIDALRGHDQVTLDMHLEAEVE